MTYAVLGSTFLGFNRNPLQILLTTTAGCALDAALGMATSGCVITSAGFTMAIVFGGFAMTELLPLQMLGVALALGVLLDASVVRLLLVFGLMVLAGRYNWLPGETMATLPLTAERSTGL